MGSGSARQVGGGWGTIRLTAALVTWSRWWMFEVRVCARVLRIPGVLFQRDAVFHRHLVFLMEETVLTQTRNLCHAPIVPQYINHSGTNSCF